MELIEYLDNPRLYANTSEFVVHLSKINGEENLFVELGKLLKFPDYFGFNWNAVDECLRDFHWIEERGIVLVHDDVPLLSEESLKIYLDVLINSIQDWKDGDDHYFKVFFPTQAKRLLKKY